MFEQNEQEMPLVSVIMPAYNAEAFIEEAINSVINQTETNWELLVIDDCSKDSTFEIAKELEKKDERIFVLRNEFNIGVAKTRNIGIERAKGKYIAFLDSDDIWHPEKLQRQLEKIIATRAGICYCSYAIIGRSGSKIRSDYIVPETVDFNMLLKENVMQCSAMLIQANILKNIKFNTEFFHEDFILGLDMLRVGHQAAGCKEILLDWRYIENSRSFNKRKAAKNRWLIYRHYLNLSIGKSFWLFVGYALAGFRKYFFK